MAFEAGRRRRRRRRRERRGAAAAMADPTKDASAVQLTGQLFCWVLILFEKSSIPWQN